MFAGVVFVANENIAAALLLGHDYSLTSRLEEDLSLSMAI
jgi:hypothetical protein